MGGCCSKCDKYLVGAPEQTKGGDTPKLARVSHSASFSGGKGDNGDIADQPKIDPSRNGVNGSLEEKQLNGKGLATKHSDESKSSVEKQAKLLSQGENFEQKLDGSLGHGEDPARNATCETEEKEVDSCVVSKDSSNKEVTTIEKQSSGIISVQTESAHAHSLESNITKEHTIEAQLTKSLGPADAGLENPTKDSLKPEEDKMSKSMVERPPERSPEDLTSLTEVSQKKAVESTQVTEKKEILNVGQTSVMSESVLVNDSSFKETALQTSTHFQSENSSLKTSVVEKISSSVEISSDLQEASVDKSNTVQSFSVEDAIQSSTVEMSSSIQSSNVEMSNSIQSSSVEMSSSIQSSTVEKSESMQSSSVEKSEIVQSSMENTLRSSSVEKSSSIQSSSVEMSSSTLSSSVQTSSTAQTSIVETSNAVQTSSLDISKAIQQTNAEMSSAIQSSSMEESCAAQSSNIQMSSAVQSTNVQSSSLEVSSAVQSSNVEMSNVDKSHVVQASSVKTTSTEQTLTEMSSNVESSVVEACNTGQLSKTEEKGAAITTSIAGIQPIANFDDITGSSNSELQISSSKSESHKTISSCVSTVLEVDGTQSSAKVIENTNEESQSETKTHKVVDGEIVLDEGTAQVHIQDTCKTSTSQGEEVCENSVAMSQSAEVAIKDGEVISSRHSSSFLENVPDANVSLQGGEEIDAGDFPPPPQTNLDDFPPPPKAEELPPPEGVDSPSDSRSSYVALVTPSGFVSPTRDETDANRRNFANSLLSDRDADNEEIK